MDAYTDKVHFYSPPPPGKTLMCTNGPLEWFLECINNNSELFKFCML